MNSKEREIQRAKEVTELLKLVREIHAEIVGLPQIPEESEEEKEKEEE